MLRRMSLYLFVVGFSLSTNAADLNQQGFELIKKGKFAEARGLVEKALEKDPSNPYAHLNMARLIYQTATDKDAETLFECQAELSEEPASAGYNILWHLSRAAESKKPDVYQKLRDEDRWLKAFRTMGLYQRWIQSIQRIPTGKELKAFLGRAEWWAYSNSGENWNAVYKFDQSGRVYKSGPDGKRSEIGTWEVAKNQMVLVKPKQSKAAMYRLSQIKTAFGQNNRFFFNLALVTPGSSVPTYILGPRVGDCGEMNY